MLKLDVHIHTRPNGMLTGDAIELDGRQVRPLLRDPKSISQPLASTQPFAIGFEEAAERLTALDPMIHLEPDGWFIWHSPKEETPVWQINGNLYDRQQKLWYVPLRGTCPEAVLQQVLSALADDPQENLMFELTQAGVHISWSDLVEFSRASEKP
jgi:hypothetical protein